MKKARPFIIVGGLSIIAYALYRYYQRQVNFLKDITYQVTGVRIVSVSSSQVSLDVTTKIYNASNVEATVREMYLDVFINNVKVGNVNEVKDILILPQKSTDITFNFSFSPRAIGANVKDLISFSLAAKDIVISLNGFVKVRSSFITATLPFEYQNNLKSFLKK